MRGLYTKKDDLKDWSAGSDGSEKYAGLGIGKIVIVKKCKLTYTVP